MGRPRAWSDDQLRSAIASARDMRMALRMLGIRPGGKTYDAIRRRAEALGVDMSHFTIRKTIRTRWTQPRASCAGGRSGPPMDGSRSSSITSTAITMTIAWRTYGPVPELP